MNLGCTKKIIDQAKIEVNPPEELDDLYNWSIHLTPIFRKNAVVVSNDLARLGFVLYGLKSADFKNLKVLVKEGIRTCLRDLLIKKEVVEQYLMDCKDITYTKTRSPKYVGRLNKASELLYVYSELIDESTMYQRGIAGRMNDDIGKLGDSKDYEHVSSYFLKHFIEVYGEDSIKNERIEVTVSLDLDVYTATRKLIVPIDYTLEQLHKIIQSSFKWQNSHLHQFILKDAINQTIVKAVSSFELEQSPIDTISVVSENEMKISDCLEQFHSMEYIYDYGDEWIHTITFGSIITRKIKNRVECLEAIQRRPPEDVGGISGYKEFLKIMENELHPNHQKVKEWAKSQWVEEPDLFSIQLWLSHL